MSLSPLTTATTATEVVRRHPWTLPRVAELPKLTALTLASAIGGGGGTSGGGSTVFGILLTLVALTGCIGDRTVGSEGTPAPTLTRTIACQGNVAQKTVTCDGGPERDAPSPEIFGGNGSFVALRSSNVAYNIGTEEFSFDVSVQNLGAQVIGTTDGVTQTGIDLFFESGPVATGGAGTINITNATGTGDFTGTGQPYFHYDTLLNNMEESFTQPWVLSVPVGVTTFSFTVLVSAQVPDLGGILTWQRVRPTNAQFGNMLDIAANSATDAMAVGASGMVMLKNSAGWKVLPDQISENWVGVEAVGNGEYVGATSVGRVYLYSRKVWRLIHQVPWTISTLTASSSQNVLVAGTSHVAWWGSNGTAADVALSSGAGYHVASAWYGGGNQWIVGSTAGQKWLGNFLAGVGGVTGGCCDLFTAIAAGGSNNPLGAISGGGNAFLKDLITSFFYVGPAADSTIDAVTYAAGGVGAFIWRATRSNTTGDTKLFSFNGSWTLRATVPGRVDQIIDDKNGGLYLVTTTGIQRWNGAAVVDEFTPISTPYSLYSVWGNDTTAIIGLPQGVFQYIDGVWTLRDPGNGNVAYGSVGGTGPDDQWAGWTAGLTHWDGASWTTVPALTGINVKALFAVPGATTLIEGKHIWMDLGAGWSQRTDADILAANDSIRSVWGSSATDIWVVTKGARVLHFNGTNWVWDHTTGFGADAHVITGSGPTDVWVAHKDSLRYWDGAAWSGNMAPPSCGIIASAVATSPGHLILTCTSDLTMRYRTQSGTGTIQTPGGWYPWYLAGGPGANVWAIGQDNFILRGRR